MPGRRARASKHARKPREVDLRDAILAAVALMASGMAPASAQIAERGRALAEAWCTGCHVVAPNEAGGDVGPAFETVANREGQTLGAVTAWLFEPHPPMPDLQLSPADFRDLSAYIMSLRKE
jgi:mono/diheme cytochrome c family protein